MKKTISLVANMMVYNDAELLPEVITRLHMFCDYLVIQDNGSTDGSLEVIKQFARSSDAVYFYPQDNPPHVANSRNQLLKATEDGKWVLKWDTDELPSTGMIGKLRDFLEEHPNENGWTVPCYHIMKQPRLCLNMEFGFGHLCLFKKFQETIWQNTIHEQISTRGPIGGILPQTGIAIIHLSYYMEKRLRRKAIYYASRPDSGFSTPDQLAGRLNSKPIPLPGFVTYDANPTWLENIRSAE